MAQKQKRIEDCTEKKTDSKIVLEEKGKKMVFLNKARKTIKIITVDGCAITAGIKCDFLVKNEEDYEYFVELKGADILHACDQLKASINQLSVNPTQNAKHSFIVASRVVPAITTRIQNLKVEFRKKFNCTLIIRTFQCEFEL